MKFKAWHFILLIVATSTLAGGVWVLTRFTPTLSAPIEPSTAVQSQPSDPNLWSRSLEKVKENRNESENTALEIPSQLRHYDERRWFLGTQVAEVKKFNLQPVQDFVDLAAVIRRGDMVPLPAVTNTYILFGVGARVNADAFTRYVADQNLELTDDGGLKDAYGRLESEHARLQQEISELQGRTNSARNHTESKQDELESEIIARKQELKSVEDDQAFINRYYGGASESGGSGAKLLRDYDSLQELAKNFGGRSFNLDDSSERATFKVYLLSSLRPQALKILEEIAELYSKKFGRPLPISSLVRPEQYQRALRRVNRYAALIDTPPHSTGLAFDINYRYMSNAEQNFVMSALARMKDEGRIEVLRERGANFHVFTFIDGKRPGDDLITASLDEIGPPAPETISPEKTKSQRTTINSRTAKNIRPTSKPNRSKSKGKTKRHS